MLRKTILITGLFSLTMLVISGCGTKQSNPQPTLPSSSSTQNITQPAQNTTNPIMEKSKYSGVENYKKFTVLATQNPKDYNSQINAGMSAYSNQDYNKAVEYYDNAIAINHTKAVAYNNIGNVYYRGLKDPQKALSYYVKATEIEPSYDYGWLNLALCQQGLKDISGAKGTVAKGLKVLSSGDPLYKSLTQLQSKLNY